MNLSSIAIPLMLFVIIVSGLIKGVGVYDAFLVGAKSGIKTSVNIVAPLIGLLAAISMFRVSGAMELICHGLAPIVSRFGFPQEALPLALLRPISGSASTAVLQDIFKTYGADSFAGRVASVISGSTETTFYTMTIYFGAVGIKNARHTVKAALFADMAGIVAATFVVSRLLG